MSEHSNTADEGVERPLIGDYLKKKRQALNIPLETIASSTKVNLSFLEAIEANDFSSLPARPYVRGFIRAFAKALGLDPDVVVRYFEETEEKSKIAHFKQMDSLKGRATERNSSLDTSFSHFETVKKKLASNEKSDFKKGALTRFAKEQASEAFTHRVGSRAIKLAGILSIILAVVIYYFSHLPRTKHTAQLPIEKTSQVPQVFSSTPTQGFWTWKEEQILGDLYEPKTPIDKTTLKQIIHEPSEETKDEAEAPPVAATPSPEKAPVKAAAVEQESEQKEAEAEVKDDRISIQDAKYVVHMKALEDVWVQFQEDDLPVRDFILRKGQQFYLRSKNLIKLFTGNLPGLEITYNGTLIPTPDGVTVKSLVFPEERLDEFELPLFKKKNDKNKKSE